MTAGAQPEARTASAPKLPANTARPTSMTSHEARRGVSEKSITRTIFLRTFFAVNAGKQIVNTVWFAFGCGQIPRVTPRRGQEAQRPAHSARLTPHRWRP